MQDKDIKFCRGLIKGKIAEIIFELMFQHTERYNLIHFGYEFTTPQLLSKDIRSPQNSSTLQSIANAPDFIEIDKLNRVTLVEVKYRKYLSIENIKLIAEKIITNWNEAWLFVATQDGFYFDPVKLIVQNNGSIHELTEEIIERTSQDKYLAVLKEFIQNN